jgi:hypothetical protein
MGDLAITSNIFRSGQDTRGDTGPDRREQRLAPLNYQLQVQFWVRQRDLSDVSAHLACLRQAINRSIPSLLLCVSFRKHRSLLANPTMDHLEQRTHHQGSAALATQRRARLLLHAAKDPPIRHRRRKTAWREEATNNSLDR